MKNIRIDFKSAGVYVVVAVLALVGALGWSFALTNSQIASAQNSSDDSVDGEELEDLYESVFHRPADKEGKEFHMGRNLKDVLRDFKNSDEQRYYGALFKAVKAYEEAQRAPGTLTTEEKQSYLDLIDSSLSNLMAWVATLPDRDPCKAVIGPEQAREAIKKAWERLSEAGKDQAEHGLLNALKQLGDPSTLIIRPKCLRSPTPTPTPTPTATPTVSPTTSVY